MPDLSFIRKEASGSAGQRNLIIDRKVKFSTHVGRLIAGFLSDVCRCIVVTRKNLMPILVLPIFLRKVCVSVRRLIAISRGQSECRQHEYDDEIHSQVSFAAGGN